MSLTALPNDCLLACLARVPYVDLRTGLPSTCKSLRDAVASSAFRKTRDASGFSEWAVYARAGVPNSTSSYLIQASATYRTVPGPLRGTPATLPGSLPILSSEHGDEIVFLHGDEFMDVDAFHPGRNSWRRLAPLSRGPDLLTVGACGGLGSTIMVIGGEPHDEPTMPNYVYDSSQDVWSRRPDFPFETPRETWSKVIEIDGKLWLYALQSGDDTIEGGVFTYDPATQTWTAGPRLPHELYPRFGVHWHLTAFELRKRFCVMGLFQRTPEDVSYLGFMWDPIQGAWQEAPFPMPPVIAHDGESIENNLIVAGNTEPSRYAGPYDRMSRLFVLKPDSSEWDEWRFPDDIVTDWRKARSTVGMSVARLG